MTGQMWQHALSRMQHVVCGALVAALLVGAPLAVAAQPESTLLVWVGDQAHQAPDFVAVIDFDRDSPHYGKVLRTVPLPVKLLGAGAVGNEPHHVGISHDGRFRLDFNHDISTGPAHPHDLAIFSADD